MSVQKYDYKKLFEAFEQCKANAPDALKDLAKKGIVMTATQLRDRMIYADELKYKAIQRKYKPAMHVRETQENRQFAETTMAKYKDVKFGPFDIVPSELIWSIQYIKRHNP